MGQQSKNRKKVKLNTEDYEDLDNESTIQSLDSQNTIKSSDIEDSTESNEINYSISKLSIDDTDQIEMLNKYSEIYSEIPKIAEFLFESGHGLKSNNYLLCFVGFLQIYKVRKYILSKRIKKFLARYNDKKLLIYQKISNLPLQMVVELFSKLEIEHEVIFISKCTNLKKNDLNRIAAEFKEYSITDLEIFPCNSEEVFFVQNNIYCEIFNSNDIFYRAYIINQEHVNKFIELIRVEIDENNNK